MHIHGASFSIRLRYLLVPLFQALYSQILNKLRNHYIAVSLQLLTFCGNKRLLIIMC